ncbi:hypothetical protein ABZX69_22895, partial [Streptomyces sp. NPDC004074]|uniref:hypothetical protein n=1 Tax=Streptomyces sp. NPDC004074 TaxID=3154277 RepID=UPI0033BA53DA
ARYGTAAADSALGDTGPGRERRRPLDKADTTRRAAADVVRRSCAGPRDDYDGLRADVTR